MKRIIVLSDLHCGHKTGLTPPRWFASDPHYAEYEQSVWIWYITKIEELGKIDLVICNGDAIDGKGYKSGGNELLTADRAEQVEIAESCLRAVRCDKIAIIRGTGYHTGNEEDWEATLAKSVDSVMYGGHEFFDVDGCIIDCKHDVGGSQMQHLRATPITRERLYNLLWNEKGIQPLSDIIIRSHRHYFIYSGTSAGVNINTPGMQGWTKYGSDKCSGTIDIGFVSIDVECDGAYSWDAHLYDIGHLTQEAYKL